MLSEGFLRKVICSLKVKLIYKLIGNSLNNVEWIVRKRNILLAYQWNILYQIHPSNFGVWFGPFIVNKWLAWAQASLLGFQIHQLIFSTSPNLTYPNMHLATDIPINFDKPHIQPVANIKVNTYSPLLTLYRFPCKSINLNSVINDTQRGICYN